MLDSFKKPKISINKVYTRSGDEGKTRLIGGQSISKSELRIWSYGEIDELNAVIGGCQEQVKKIRPQGKDIKSLLKNLTVVQHQLFNLGTVLAALPEDLTKKMPKITQSDIKWLEDNIDIFNQDLNDLQSFVLPGGSETSTWFHLARTVCRRAERSITALSEKEKLDNLIIQYINRLSDACFVWSRWILKSEGNQENLWDPNFAKDR